MTANALQRVVVAVVLLNASATAAILCATGPYGSMPDAWADQAHVATGTKDPSGNNALAGMVGQVADRAMPNGGPQAFECYTYDAHPDGITRLVMGCIGNVELAGDGHTIEVRGIQSGGIITGNGDVDEWTGLTLSRPKEHRPGQLRQYTAVAFANGWKLVEQGEQLLICPPRSGSCRAF